MEEILFKTISSRENCQKACHFHLCEIFALKFPAQKFYLQYFHDHDTQKHSLKIFVHTFIAQEASISSKSLEDCT